MKDGEWRMKDGGDVVLYEIYRIKSGFQIASSAIKYGWWHTIQKHWPNIKQ